MTVLALYLELDSRLGVGIENLLNSKSCLDRHSGLFHDNGVAVTDSRNCSRCQLCVRKVSGTAGTHTLGLGWGVDSDEHNVSLLDRFVNLGGEKQVAATALLDSLVESRPAPFATHNVLPREFKARLFRSRQGSLPSL